MRPGDSGPGPNSLDSAVAHALPLPPFPLVFFGSITDEFGVATTAAELVDGVTESAIIILYLGAGAFVTSYLQVTFFTLTAQRQALRIRRLYFTALVRQEMAWFDQQATGALSSRISSDIPKIQDAIGDKVASFLQFTGMCIAGFCVGFAYGWQLTLVILAITPIMGLGGALMSKMLSEAASGEQGFYALAGAIADEVLHMIRTVVAFDTQDKVRRTHFCLCLPCPLQVRQDSPLGWSEANTTNTGKESFIPT